MLRLWFKLRCLGTTLLLATAGCASTEPNLKPPTHPEEFNLPPVADSRYSNPVTYPDDTLVSGRPRKKQGDNSPLTDPARFATGGGGGPGNFAGS